MHITRILVTAGFLLALWPPLAHADVGGTVPSPGNCEYPAVGTFGMEFGVDHYSCAFPMEINGSHHQCIYAGIAAQATGGVSFMFVNASISLPVGVLEGVCYWACPDLTQADPPNPPGAWKSYLPPTKCKTIGESPVKFEPPAGPPNDAPAAEDPSPLLAPVTDPVQGNPDATVNKPR